MDQEGEDEVGCEVVEIHKEDAAFVLGPRGVTRMKIANVSGCEVDLIQEENEGQKLLEFSGTGKQRRVAMKYCRCVMAQRTGEVYITDAEAAEDCTQIDVPKEAVALVTGKGGSHLRTLEDNHHVLMCFASIEGTKKVPEYDTLTIFGSRKGRRGAQLDIMSSVESKIPDYWSSSWRTRNETFDQSSDLVGGWGTTVRELTESQMPIALGKKGGTRKKLGKASGAVVQFIGLFCFMSGTEEERRHAQEYMDWLFEQQHSPIHFDVEGRDDCCKMKLPTECVRYICGQAREGLTNLEEEFGVFAFFQDRKKNDMPNPNGETLIIFGPERNRRGAELQIMSAVERKWPGSFTEGITAWTSTSEGFDIDHLILEDNNVSYACGKEGNTRTKLAKSSGALFYIVGKVAFIGGDVEQRKRCHDYLEFLFDLKDKSSFYIDVAARTDVTEVEVPEGKREILEEKANDNLRFIEKECEVFCIMGEDRLIILGHKEGTPFGGIGRLRAAKLAEIIMNGGYVGREGEENPKERKGEKGKGKGKGKGDKGGRRYYDDDRNDGRHRDYRDRNRSRSPVRRPMDSRQRRDDRDNWSSSRRDDWSSKEEWSHGGGKGRDSRYASQARGRYARSRTPPRKNYHGAPWRSHGKGGYALE